MTEYSKEIENKLITSQVINISNKTKKNKCNNSLEHKIKTNRITNKQAVSFGNNEWTVVSADGKAHLQFYLSKFTSAEKIDQTQTNLQILAISQVFHEFDLGNNVLPDNEPQGVRDTAHAIRRAAITGNLKQFCNE